MSLLLGGRIFETSSTGSQHIHLRCSSPKFTEHSTLEIRIATDNQFIQAFRSSRNPLDIARHNPYIRTVLPNIESLTPAVFGAVVPATPTPIVRLLMQS